MKNFLWSMFSGKEDGISIKAVIAFMGSLFLCITLLSNSFYDDTRYPAEELTAAVEYIVIAAMFANTADFFNSAFGGKKSNKQESSNITE